MHQSGFLFRRVNLAEQDERLSVEQGVMTDGAEQSGHARAEALVAARPAMLLLGQRVRIERRHLLAGMAAPVHGYASTRPVAPTWMGTSGTPLSISTTTYSGRRAAATSASFWHARQA